MILFCALGGGLGHMTRSIAILSHASFCSHTRMLVSSDLTRLAAPASPCHVDAVPRSAMESRTAYYEFLTDYLLKHRIRAIVLDTFPFGIVGEWADLAPEIPRIVLARYLRWNAYVERIGMVETVWPHRFLTLEALEPEYLRSLEVHSSVAVLESPIALIPARQPRNRSDTWAVVHSGPDHECDFLLSEAKKQMREQGHHGEPELFFPGQNIYPAWDRLTSENVVSGAGYNMCAQAVIDRTRNYVLHSFPRRFDNQELRQKRLEGGTWISGGRDGARQAAAWLEESLGEFS